MKKNRSRAEQAARDIKAARLKAGRRADTAETRRLARKGWLIARPKPELGLWEERAK
jgi:hypothetical protein